MKNFSRHPLNATSSGPLPVDLEPAELVVQRPQQRPIAIGPLLERQCSGVRLQAFPGDAEAVEQRRPRGCEIRTTLVIHDGNLRLASLRRRKLALLDLVGVAGRALQGVQV